MDATLEQRAATAQRRVATPSVRALALRRVERHEPDLAEIARPNAPAQLLRDRLVRVVLGYEHAPSGGTRRGANDVRVTRPHERRLLDDHVLTCREGLLRQLAVRHRRRRDERDVDERLGQPIFIRSECATPSVAPAIVFGAGAIEAREEQLDAADASQRAGMNPGRRAAAEEENAKLFGCR